MTARQLLEVWRGRFGGGMVPFDKAYHEVLATGAIPAHAQMAGAYAMLTQFVDELEQIEAEA